MQGLAGQASLSIGTQQAPSRISKLALQAIVGTGVLVQGEEGSSKFLWVIANHLRAPPVGIPAKGNWAIMIDLNLE